MTPRDLLEPDSGTAYVQEVPEANLLDFLFSVKPHSECRGLEVQTPPLRHQQKRGGGGTPQMLTKKAPNGASEQQREAHWFWDNK